VNHLVPRVDAYLKSCQELACFCTRNGWIDMHSLRFLILREFGNELIVEIEFDEWLPETTGNGGVRIPCRGQLLLVTDRYGHVTRAEAL
jgi:hypothetical protein